MRSTSFFTWATAATLALAFAAPRAASAEERGSAWPSAAAHLGRIEGDHVTWQTSFVRNTSAETSESPPAWERIDLARPVLAELDTARSPGIAAVADGKGAIVAFVVDTRRLSSWREDVTVVVRAPLVREGEEVVLTPPHARGGAGQRIEVSGEGELRFEPEASLGFIHEVGSWATPGISEAGRRESDALLGGRDTPLDESPIYVESTYSALERGLRGRALTATERARPGLILAVIVFVVLAAAAAAAYRRLSRDARIEQAEATLREEFERDEREA